MRESSAARRRRQPHRSLVAVRVEQHRAPARRAAAATRGRPRTRVRDTPRTARRPGTPSRLLAARRRAAAPARLRAAPTGSSARRNTIASPRARGVVQRVDVARGEPARRSEQALRDERTAAAAVRHRAGAPMPARLEHVRPRPSPISGSTCSVKCRRRAPRRTGDAATAARQRAAAFRRRRSVRASTPASRAGGRCRQLSRASQRADRAAGDDVRQRRQPAAPCASACTWPNAPRAGAPWRFQWSARNSLLMRAMSTLVGTLALAGPALEAQVERLVQPWSSSPASPSWPVIASRSTLARPRVVWASSRVAM